MDVPPTDLNYYLNKLVEFVSELIDSDQWESILITEMLELKPNKETIVVINECWDPKQYEKRFYQIVTKGYGWVNMHVYGVLNKKLIVDISWPVSKPGSIPVASVNLSGPEKWIQDKECLLSGVLKIENLV